MTQNGYVAAIENLQTKWLPTLNLIAIIVNLCGNSLLGSGVRRCF